MMTVFSLANEADAEKIYFDSRIELINKNKYNDYIYFNVSPKVFNYSVIWKCGDIKKVKPILSKEEIKSKVTKFCIDKLGKDFVISKSAKITTVNLREVEIYFVRLDVKNFSDFIREQIIPPHVMIPVNKNGDILCELKPTKR